MHSIFMKSRFYLFLLVLMTFVSYLRKYYPPHFYQDFVQCFLQNSLIAIVLTHLTHFELCFACRGGSRVHVHLSHIDTETMLVPFIETLCLPHYIALVHCKLLIDLICIDLFKIICCSID